MIRVVVFVSCFIGVISYAIGDNCILTTTKSVGSCIPITRCKPAMDDLRRRGIPPQSCGFGDGGVSLVCCPNIWSTSSGTSNTSSKTNESNDDCVYPPGAITVNENDHPNIAWKKCIELADTIFPCAQRSFEIGAKKTRVSQCQREGIALIFGGTPAKPNEFPHMAALGYTKSGENKTEWNCGGTLISEQWIMSAAQCVYDRKLQVMVSKASLGADFDIKNIFEIIERVKHPDYKGNLNYNDISLFKTDRPVKYSRSILPACLHIGNNVNDNEAIAIGFGKTSLHEDAKLSNELLKVTLNKFTKEECSSEFRPQRRSPNGIIDTQICYGSKNESKDTCQGDGGGPLQIVNLGVHCTYTVIGITSVGKSCGTIGVPAIYTRVSAYIPWIESVVWPN